MTSGDSLCCSQPTRPRMFVPTEAAIVAERIIAASTNEGDLVADFFGGSGTVRLPPRSSATLDRLRPRPLRYPHHAKATPQHPGLQAVRHQEPWRLRAPAVAASPGNGALPTT